MSDPRYRPPHPNWSRPATGGSSGAVPRPAAPTAPAAPASGPHSPRLPPPSGPQPPVASGSHGRASSPSLALRFAPPGYEILGELGRGGMGVVYKARDLRLGRLVALKVLLGGTHAGTADLERFRTEAEVIAGLSHPHIVQIFEVGEHGGLPYCCLEFCGGGTLSGRAAGQPQTPRSAAETLAVIAEAVHAAHAAGVVHRDIKPSNVLLDAVGTPKLTDFGLAKRLASDAVPGSAGSGPALTRSGEAVGTPQYMAPEQLDASSSVGPAADVYSLGAMLYELLSGRPPFLGESEVNTLWMVMSQEPVPLRQLQPRVPADLETICHKCLHKEPARRYASAAELAGDLRRFLRGEPIRARPVGRLERAVKWARRHPAAAALIAVSVAGLAGLIAVGAVYNAKLAAKNADLDAANGKLLSAAEQEKQLRRAAESAADEARRARDDAETRRVEAERARTASEQARKRAAANFGLADTAVDKLFTLVRDSTPLHRRADLQPLRQQLLGLALDYSRQFVSQDDARAGAVGSRDPQSREYRRAIGATQLRICGLADDLGRSTEILSAAEGAVRIFGALSESDPADAEARLNLGRALVQRSVGHLRIGNATAGLADAKAATELLAQLANEHGSNLEFHSATAAAYAHYGELLVRAGRYDEGLQYQNKALEAKQILVERHPDTQNRMLLGQSRINFGVLLLRLSRPDLAVEQQRAGLAVWEGLLRENKQSALLWNWWAESQDRLGVALAATGEATAATDCHRKSVKIRESLVKEHPGLADYAAALAESRGLLAGQLTRQNSHAEALEQLASAAALAERLATEDASNPERIALLIRTLANLAGTRADTGDAAGGERDSRRAIELQKKLSAAQPEQVDHNAILAQLHHNFALQLARAGRLDAALEQHAAAVAEQDRILAASDLHQHRWNLSVWLHYQGATAARAGRAELARGAHRRAVTVMEKLLAEQPAFGDLVPMLTASRRALAELLASAARDPSDLSSPALAEALATLEAGIAFWDNLAAAQPTFPRFRVEAAELRIEAAVLLCRTSSASSLDRAMRLLEPAAGHLSVELRQRLAKEPAFAPLRARPEFRRLLGS